MALGRLVQVRNEPMMLGRAWPPARSSTVRTIPTASRNFGSPASLKGIDAGTTCKQFYRT